jgi:glycosyltransferase involved in cell wall biosynthesis
MPIALIEAMGVGTPVVSTPWAGAEEMLDRGRLGYVAADFEPATVARTLAEALRDPQGALAKAHAARERALASYELGAAARRHLELYRSLVETS